MYLELRFGTSAQLEVVKHDELSGLYLRRYVRAFTFPGIEVARHDLKPPLKAVHIARTASSSSQSDVFPSI